MRDLEILGDSPEAGSWTSRNWPDRVGAALFLLGQVGVFAICFKWWTEKHQVFDAIAAAVMLAAIFSDLSYKFTVLRRVRVLPIGERTLPDVVSTVAALLFAQRWSERHEVGDAIASILMFAFACFGFAYDAYRARKPRIS